MFLDLEVGALTEPLSGRQWNGREIMMRLLRRAALYADRGLGPGDRVFLHYGNSMEFFVDLLAIWTLGGCAIPVDPRLTPFEVEALAGAARPRFSVWLEPPEDAFSAVLARFGVYAILAAEEGRELPVSSSHPNLLDQDALILFTSGTTGQPKGVVHTHRSLRARWVSLRHSLGVSSYRHTLCLLPTHFGHGLICNCLFPWLSGQHLFILPPFRPEIVMRLGNLIDDNRITAMSSVPPIWRIALKTANPPRLRTLERVSCGSAPLSADLWKSIQEWSATDEVFNAYGITETGSWLAGTTVPGFEPEDGLIGEAWGGVIRVLRTGSTETAPEVAEPCGSGEPGHVWVNTPALMRGYLDRDDLTAKVVRHGWFSTGDIGVIDERGRLYLRGREREEINKGGMKIYPGDVDAVAERHEVVTDVCTFGIEDPLHGEAVGIALVLASTDDEALGRLHDWMSLHLARHQMPERWYLLKEIPRTSRGKINRETVAQGCTTLKAIDIRRVLRKRNE